MDEIDRDENTLSSRPAEVNPPVSSETPAGATETSIETFPPQTDAEIVRAELETAAQERIRGRDPISAGEIRIIDAEEEGKREMEKAEEEMDKEREKDVWRKGRADIDRRTLYANIAEVRRKDESVKRAGEVSVEGEGEKGEVQGVKGETTKVNEGDIGAAGE